MGRSTLVLIAVTLAASSASAQSLGTFTWQLQPYCNVMTVHVTGVAGVYTLEGFDDQCGADTRAPLTGVATQNPDGTIGFGLHLVPSPGGRGVQVEARVSIASLGGPWTDSDGNKGTFAFNQRTGGNRRPIGVVSQSIPAAIGLKADGGFVATGAAGTGTIPASGPGTRMMWHPGKYAFRAGIVVDDQWDDAQIGAGSVAFGDSTVASGLASFAHGDRAQALGATSTALGSRTVARGVASFATGTNTEAAGDYAVTFGRETKALGVGSFAAGLRSTASGTFAWAFGLDAKASGISSFAFGVDATAGGPESVAIGPNAGASGQGAIALGERVRVAGVQAAAIGSELGAAGEGSVALGTNAGTSDVAAGAFVFGDRSTTSIVTAQAPNLFLARAAGGANFFTNAALTTGVKLPPNGNAWLTLSDVNSKENFRDLDGAEVLAKLAAMPIREWNYKAQDAAIRHVGPTAQDFHAAFGLGEDPLRISTIDADGIALAAVQALEARTRTENEALARANADRARESRELREALDALRTEIDALRDIVVVPPKR